MPAVMFEPTPTYTVNFKKIKSNYLASDDFPDLSFFLLAIPAQKIVPSLFFLPVMSDCSTYYFLFGFVLL